MTRNADIPKDLRLTLWDLAYRLAEREKRWVDRLPQLLRRRVPDWPLDRTVAVDVGANVGTYSRSLARWCRQVHAIEPNRALADNLRRAAQEDVAIHPVAAGRAAGTAYLTDQSVDGHRRPLARLGDPAGAAWSQACTVQRLDAIVPPGPAALFVKIDTEGTEADVIEGMGELLATDFLILMIEIEARHNPGYPALFDRLARAGLTANRLFLRRLIPAAPGDVAKSARGPGGRFHSLWPWGNNYIFLRSAVAARLAARPAGPA